MINRVRADKGRTPSEESRGLSKWFGRARTKAIDADVFVPERIIYDETDYHEELRKLIEESLENKS